MNILLTGGSGFIGKNILESELFGKYNLLAPTSKELNCIDEESVKNFFRRNQVDVVIHSAVKPGHRNAKDLSDVFYSNVRMFYNLERFSSEFQKMLVIGSGAIYDHRNYRPKMKEDSYRDHIPSDDHGFCKYVCEKVIEKSSNIYDLRVFGVFGKYEDYAIRFISNAICKAICDLPITIRQDRKFDYLYIDDLMPILEFFIENQPHHHAYNITPDHSIALSELAKIVLEVSGKTLPIQIGQEGLGLEYSGENHRLREEFPAVSFTPIHQSIKELYRWYSDHQSQINKEFLLVDK